MDESSQGIILRVRPFTETSLIVHWLTPKYGRLSTIAKGARRTKSALRGKIDLLFDAEFSFRRSRRSDLHILHSVIGGVISLLKNYTRRKLRLLYKMMIIELFLSFHIKASILLLAQLRLM